MTQETAVEWLIEQLKEYGWADIEDSQNWIIKIDALILTAKVEQAKTMEKEQMINAYNSGRWSLVPDPDGEEYYNRKYSQPK